MNKHTPTNRGFIGLLSLLITVAIISVVVWRSDLLSSNAKKQNQIEQGTGAIEAAENAKNLIEMGNSKTMEGL